MRKSRYATLTVLTFFSMALSIVTLCSCAKVVAQDAAPRATVVAQAEAPRAILVAQADAPSGAVVAKPIISDPAPAADADDGQEVLTRGPIHEAFAKPGSSEEPSDVEVKRQPPEPIEEMPPDQKPDGDNVVWISGYWSFDDDRDDFIWVSGVWRDTPDGCTWVPGYWAQDDDVYRWVPGYWRKAKSAVVEAYVPAPPRTIEIGPTSESPADNYVWAPGCWIYSDVRYVWRPGYWLESRPERIYVAPTYNWTPAGYLYVDGYWDYPLERRGVIFAPIYFGPRFVARPAFIYTPAVVIETDMFITHLFVSPRRGYYCYGDYYATSYVSAGFFPFVDIDLHFNVGFHDPIFNYYRHHGYRGDRDWEDHFRRDYRDRRDHPDFRPPRTYRAQQNWMNERPDRAGDRNAVMARPLRDVVQRPTGNTRFTTVDDSRRRTIATQAREQQVERKKTTPVVPRAERERPAPTTNPDRGTPSTRPGRPTATPEAGKRPGRGDDTTPVRPERGTTTTRPERPTATPEVGKRPGATDDTKRPSTRPAATPVTIKRPPRGDNEATTPKTEQPAPARPDRSERPTATPETSRRPGRSADEVTPQNERPATQPTRPERPAATPEAVNRPSRGNDEPTARPQVDRPASRPTRADPAPEARRPSRAGDETPPSIESRPAPRSERPSGAPAPDRPAARKGEDAAPSRNAGRMAPGDDPADDRTGRGGGGR